LDIHVLNIQVHITILKEIVVVHVSKDPFTNVNETIKVPQHPNTSKDKFKQFGGLVPTSFELDMNTTLIHVWAQMTLIMFRRTLFKMQNLGLRSQSLMHWMIFIFQMSI